MIKPSKRLIGITITLAGLGVAYGLARIVWPDTSKLAPAFTGSVALFALAALVDLLSSVRLRQITATRKLNHILPVGKKTAVEINLFNPLPYPLKVLVADHTPAKLQPQAAAAHLSLASSSDTRHRYESVPQARGDAEFNLLDIWIWSHMQLWCLRQRESLIQAVKIYPDYISLLQLAGLEHNTKAIQLGIHLQQRRGEGSEFRQLREFRQGDSLRSIDWKASSRMDHLIAREYQDERNKEVVFMLDSGRRLHSKQSNLSHFDQCLNAVILLTYVALNKGDKVGFKSFAGTNIWVPPQKGASALPLLLRKVYDLHSTLAAPDYLTCAKDLLSRLNQRALIILISNFSSDQSDEIATAAKLLQQKHLVLAVDLRELYIDDTLQQPVTTFTDALQFAGVCDHLNRREQLQSALLSMGIRLLDCAPAQLPSRLVNAYLAMKRAGTA